MLTMHREARSEILSQLREIYDGSFTKEFGTGQTVAWEGRLGLIAGVTPVVDNHRVVTALLGERFVYLRLPQEDRQAISRRALKMRAREHEMRQHLQDVVTAFLAGLDASDGELSEAATERVILLSDFATWVRSGVERDSYSTRDILTHPEPEAPARFAKQIASLSAALVAIGYDEAGALQLILRVAYDSMPPSRLRTLRLLRPVDTLSTPQAADSLGLPTTTATRILEDLTALGIVERVAGSGGAGGAHRWRLSDRAMGLWESVEMPPEMSDLTPLSLVRPPNSLSSPSRSDFSGDIEGEA